MNATDVYRSVPPVSRRADRIVGQRPPGYCHYPEARRTNPEIASSDRSRRRRRQTPLAENGCIENWLCTASRPCLDAHAGRQRGRWPRFGLSPPAPRFSSRCGRPGRLRRCETLKGKAIRTHGARHNPVR